MKNKTEKTFIVYVHAVETYDGSFTINAKNKKEAKNKIQEILDDDSTDRNYLTDRLFDKGSNGADIKVGSVELSPNPTPTPDFDADAEEDDN